MTTGLSIYGVARTRAFRALWAAEELGLAYQHRPIEIGEAGARTPEFLALNPNGRLPVIVDGGFVLSESLAITLYLAKKHGTGTLYPATLEGEAKAWQWSFWAIAEVDRAVNIWSLHAVRLPPAERDAACAKRRLKSWRRRSRCSTRRWPRPLISSATPSRWPISMLPPSSAAPSTWISPRCRTSRLGLCAASTGRRRAAALALKTKSDNETPAEVTRRIARINRL